MRTALDFRTSNGDTNYPDADAVLPVTDGEAASQAILRRPTENVRNRSEVLRDYLQEHMLLQEMTPRLYQGDVYAMPYIAFGGAYPSGSGAFTIGNDLVISNLTTPGGDPSLYPYVRSTKAVLYAGTPSSNELVFTSIKKQYEGSSFPAADSDEIAVEIVAGSSLTVTTKGAAGDLNHIYVTIISGTTTCQDVINAITASSPANTLVVVTLGAGSTGTNPAPLWGPAQWAGDYTQRFLKGGFPGTVHTITPSVLATFFAASVDNRLQAGDSICIWYDKTVDKSGTGGRLQSTYENSNYAIPAGSLFNSRREPWKLPNSIPICKCVSGMASNGVLLFADGSYIQEGVPAALGTDSFYLMNIWRGIVYATGWGWTKLNAGIHTPPADIKETFDNVDGYIAALVGHTGTFVSVTDGTLSAGGMFNGISALQDAFVALAAGSGGTIFVKTGNYNITTQLSTRKPIRIIGVEDTVSVSCRNTSLHAFRFNSGASGSRIENVNLNAGPGSNRQMVSINVDRVHFSRVYAEGTFQIRAGFCKFDQCGIVSNNFLIDADSSVSNLVVENSYLTSNGASTQMVSLMGAQCTFNNVNFTVPDTVICINTSVGARVSLANCKITCSPFTAGSWVVSIEGGYIHMSHVKWVVAGTGHIRTGLINVQADEFVGEDLWFDLNNQQLHYGAFNSPFIFACANGEVDGLKIINAGKIPTNGADGYVLDGDTPYIMCTGFGGQMTIRNAHISGFDITASPSMGIDMTIIGDKGSSGKYTYAGKSNLENVYIDVTGIDYWSSGVGVNVFRNIQPDSTYRGCTVMLGATGKIGMVWNVLHTVNVIMDGNTIRSEFGSLIKYVLAMYGTASDLKNCSFTNNTCSVWELDPAGNFVWIDAMTATESHTINNNRLILEPGSGAADIVKLGTNTYYCTVVGNIIRKGMGFGIVDNGTGNLSAALNVIW